MDELRFNEASGLNVLKPNKNVRPFDYLDANLIEQSNADEREYLSSADGIVAEQRIKTRNFVRSKYGNSYLSDYGREMTDDEVDYFIRQSFKIEDDKQIDYYQINEDLKAQDANYTGDFEQFTGGERFLGGIGALAQTVEFIMEELASLQTLPNNAELPFKPSAKEIDSEAFRKSLISAKSAINESIQLPESLRNNLMELQANAASDDVASFSAAFDAFLANAGNLVIGQLPPQLGLPAMISIEKRSTINDFEKLFGVPSIIDPDDPNIDNLNDKRQKAELFAQVYGVASGIVEYYQNNLIGKIAGYISPRKKIARELINTLPGHLKKLGIAGVGNIAEEITQQGAFNAIYNLAVDYAKDNYNIEASKVNITDDLGESALMAGRISFIAAFPGTAIRGFQSRNFINQQTQTLVEFGFSEARAKEYARDLANAASDITKYEEVSKRIQNDKVNIDLAKDAKIQLEKLNRVHDETGLITANGDILTNQDFDRIALQYSGEELSNLVADPVAAPIFRRAVYGDMDARKSYNDIIQGKDPSVKVVEDVAPEEEELGVIAVAEDSDSGIDTTTPITDLYELNDNQKELVTEILDGVHDDNITLEENETIEEARERTVEVFYKEFGTKKETKTEQKEEMSWEDVKKRAKELNIKVSGKGRTRAVVTQEVQRAEQTKEATDFTSDNPRANEQSQKLINVLKNVVPNIKVKFAKNNENFKAMTGRVARAFFNMDDTIIVNPKRANPGSLAHEATHAIWYETFKTNKAMRYAAARLLDDMLATATLTPSARERMTKFRSLYIRNGMLSDFKEEQLSELAAMIREGMNVFERSAKSRARDFLANVFKGFINVSDETRAIRLLEVIAGKVESGEAIFKDDLSLLNDILAEDNFPEGYESEGETEYKSDKFQQSYYDSDTKMGYSYDIDRDKFIQLEEDGYITRKFSLRHFNGKLMLVHQPDGAFSGEIERDGVVLIRGKGGVNFPLKFNELGYFWAGSGKDGNDKNMKSFVNKLNSMIEANGGTILMGLSSAPRGKELGTTIGSLGVLDTLQNLVNDPSFSLTQEQLNIALIDATSRKYMGQGNPRNFLNINTTDQSVIRKILGAFESNFQERSNFAIGLINSLSDQAEKNPKLKQALLDLYNSIKYEQPEEKNKPEKGTSLRVKGKAFFSEFQTEPLLKNSIPGEPSINRLNGGQVYAVIEINSPVELLKTPESFNAHESYPFVVASKNGSRPVVHILKDRYNKMDGFSDVEKQKDKSYKSTGKPIPEDRKLRVFPEQAGVSVTPLVVMTKGKPQLSSDYSLNFDRIPQVVEAIKRYFAGEITYEEFIDIQQKFDPIRRFSVVPQIPTTQQIKDVLKENQIPLVNKKPKEGTIVGLRLDIPAYTKTDEDGNPIGQYVVTMHAKGGKAIAYTSTARAKNVRMVSPTTTVARIAVGQIAKTSVSVMQGEYIEATDKQNYELALELMNNPNWIQIGYNPFRRSFFYVREGENVGMPVLGAEEVVQIGGLVFAKNADIVTPDHPKFRLQKEAQKETLNIFRDDAKFQLDKENEKTKAAFFFAGMGTAELALLKKYGIDVVQTAELEQGIVDVYNIVHGTAEVPVDVLNIDPKELIKKGIEFIHMSPPCQAFSAAREKGKVTEEDFQLEMKIARKLADIITKVKPKNLTIENAPSYQDSEQYAVIRKALDKAGYFIREQTPNAKNYGGNSMRKRLIVQASLTKLPEEPKTTKAGNWFEAIKPYIKDAPVDHAIQFTGGQKDFFPKPVLNLLNNIASGKYDPNIAYVNPGGDGQYRPETQAGNALTANFIYDSKKRKQGVKEKLRNKDGELYGSSAVMRIALPVRRLVEGLGVRAVADMYGASIKDIVEAQYGTGFLFKRATTEMLLAYMNLDPNIKLTDNVRLNRAVLGNGIQGVITREFIEPMIGKPQLSNDYINNRLSEIEQEKQQKQEEENKEFLDNLNKPKAVEPEAIEEEEVVEVSEEVRDFYKGSNYNEEYIRDAEFIYGNTKLTLKEINKLLMSIGEAGLTRPAVRRFATLVANAARDFNLNDIEALAKDVMDNDDIILTDQQHASMVLAALKLKNQHELIRTSMEEGRHSNIDVDLPNSIEDILASLSLIVRADAKSGSATGRALNARRIAMGEDNSLVGVTRRAVQMSKGTVTEEQLKELTEKQKIWEDTTRKIEKERRKEYAKTSEADVAKSKKFIEDNKKKRGKVKKTKLSSKEKLIKRMRDRGVNIDDFGKNQLSEISIPLAKDIREMAKILVLEQGYNDLNEIVDVIRQALPDVNVNDILGSISGRIQKVSQTQTQAQKTLKRLTLQSDLMVQINNGLKNIFDPVRKQAPKNKDIIVLRDQLNELKTIARQNANEVQQIQRLLTQIEYMEKLIDEVLHSGTRSTELTPKREPKKKSERLISVEQKLFVKKAELRAADKIVLLKQIIEYGEPPTIPGVPRSAQSQQLDRMRIEIAALENEIKEAKKQKADAERKARIKAEQEARLESLINQVEGWYRDNIPPTQQAELNETQKSIKEQQRLLKQQDRIAELSEILRTGVLPQKEDRQIETQTEFTETINDLQQQLKQQEWYQQIKQAEFEQRRIGQVEAKIEEQRRVLDENDFSDFMTPKEKKEIRSPELKALLTEQRANERAIRKAIRALKPRTKLEQFGDIMSLGRAFMATGDMSGFLKQGFILSLRHPKQAAKAMSEAFKSFFDADHADLIMMELESQDTQVIREQSGLFFSNLDTGMIDSEEQFNSNALNWIYKNTGYYGKAVEQVMGASERNMVVFLNLIRATAFDTYLQANPKATDLELKSYAHWINTVSGRGDFGMAEGAVQALSVLAFSPRFAASRFLMPFEAITKTARAFKKTDDPAEQEANKRVAEEIAKQYFALYSMGAVTFALAIMAGGSVNLDEPEESDFLKITFGNVKIDIWAGLGPNKRLFSLYMDSIFKQLRGEEVKADIPTKTLNTLVKYKASPWISGLLEAVGGKRYVSREPVTVPEILLERAFPLTASSIYQNWREDATTGEIMAEFGGEFFGLGVNVQPPKKKSSKRIRGL